MGIIYKLISPSNKSYIGQHKTEDVTHRLKTHVNGFNTYMNNVKEHEQLQLKNPNVVINATFSKGCVLLYKAFAKYKPDQFKCIVLHTNIPLCNLNELEDRCIIEHNTLAPNGYNLRLNYNYDGSTALSEETKIRFSEAAKLKNKKYLDKYRTYKDELKDMPQYIIFYTDNEGYRGYKVANNPKCSCKSFISKTKPLEQLKQSCLEFVNSLNIQPYIKEPRPLPIGICKPKARNGYMAYFKFNKKKYSKYFNEFDTEHENLQTAIKWLSDTKQRVLNNTQI